MSQLPAGYQYRGFCGARAQERYLTQRWAQVARLKDDASVGARKRLLAAVVGDPESERMLLQLSNVAMLTAERVAGEQGAPCSWAEAMHAVLDLIDQTTEKVAAYRTPRPRASALPGLIARVAWARVCRWFRRSNA